MKIKSEIQSFLTGLLVGALLTAAYAQYMVVNPVQELISRTQEVIKECEQHLPRNVHCELKAVVAFPEINEEK